MGQFFRLEQRLAVGAAAQERRDQRARARAGAKDQVAGLPPQQRAVGQTSLLKYEYGEAQEQRVHDEEGPERRVFGVHCHWRRG